MFQFIRRVSCVFLPRPDRPWRDDATSNAPTIGRKRRHSVTEQDDDGSAASAAKRTKSNPVDAECDAVSGGENSEGNLAPLVERQDVKEVTKGVKEVDLEDKDKLEDVLSIRPEGVPLPDSPSGSPEPESELQESEPEPEPAESDEVETKDQEAADDKDSVASSAPEQGADVTTNTDTEADEIAPAPEVAIPVKSSLHDTLEVLEVKA